MIYALRWAAMGAILMFHNCERQSHKTVSTDHNIWRERRAEADSNRGPSAYQPNALPLGQTGSPILVGIFDRFYNSTILRSRADSRHYAFVTCDPKWVTVALYQWARFEFATVSARSVYTIQPHDAPCHVTSVVQSRLHT